MQYSKSLFSLFFCIGFLFIQANAQKSSPAIFIKTCQDLQNIKHDLNGHYVISHDIDCSGFEWEVIAGEFQGSLDGNNHTIDNLAIYTGVHDNDETRYGLFYQLTQANIKNIHFRNAMLSPRDDTRFSVIAGILSARSYYSTISNIIFSHTKATLGDAYEFGFISGMMAGSTIENIKITDSHFAINSILNAGFVTGNALCSAWGAERAKPGAIKAAVIENSNAKVLIPQGYFGGVTGSSIDCSLVKNTLDNVIIETGDAKTNSVFHMGGLAGYLGIESSIVYKNKVSNIHIKDNSIRDSESAIDQVNYAGGLAGLLDYHYGVATVQPMVSENYIAITLSTKMEDKTNLKGFYGGLIGAFHGMDYIQYFYRPEKRKTIPIHNNLVYFDFNYLGVATQTNICVAGFMCSVEGDSSAGAILADVSKNLVVATYHYNFKQNKTIAGFANGSPFFVNYSDNFWDIETARIMSANDTTGRGLPTLQLKSPDTFLNAGWDSRIWKLEWGFYPDLGILKNEFRASAIRLE